MTDNTTVLDNREDLDTPGAGVVPVSQDQAGLWFLQKMAPNNAAYNVVFSLRILSAINEQVLEKSFQLLVDRHPVLRTTIVSCDGVPVQQQQQDIKLPFNTEDLSSLPEDEIKRVITADTQRPFNLETDCMLRISLFAVGANAHILVLTAHHIAVDLWSLALILEEFKAIYPVLLHNQVPALEPVSATYASHALEQQVALSGEEGRRLLAFWKDKLAGELPVLNLETDKLRPPLQTYRGATEYFSIDKTTSMLLAEMAKTSGATLYMVLLTAFQVLMHRYTRQDTILVGAPMAGRTRKQYRNVVGNFVNTVVLKARFSAQQTFRELLGQAKDEVVEAIRHQHYPFSLLVKELSLERDPSRAPLVQVAFGWEKLPQMKSLSKLFVSDASATEDNLFGGLEIESYRVPQQEGQYELNLEMGGESNGELFGCFKYNSDLFSARRISRLAGHFKTLLAAIANDIDQPVAALPMLTAAELQTVLHEWNDTAVDFPAHLQMHALFGQQALAAPGRRAVRFEDDSITYGELEARSENLAQYLVALQTGPGSFVGIFINRSIDMVVALLGVLKTGAAYVPLDPAFPKERLAYMIADAQLDVILTHSSLVAELPLNQATIISLDAEREKIEAVDQQLLPASIAADSIAYMIYTSGSTGKPKGVLVKHGAVVNFLLGMQKKPGITPADVLLSVTTLSFDIAVLEIFLPLSTGAELVLIPRSVASDGKELAKKIRCSEATMMQATPSTWQLLLEAGWKGEAGLKILTGGEALSMELAQRLLPCGDVVWNMFGPTETTIWSTCAQIMPGDEIVTIGKPIDNTQIYILDEHLQPVSIGMAGDLYIGGQGLAAGYHNRPELTAERFISNPFSTTREKIYKTGDVAKYLEDGRIKYLGRSDNQVKVRGFRIELGEIEAAIRKHPAVKDVVVRVYESVSSDKKLLAYYIPADQAGASTSPDLRSFLRESLPEYMVPAQCIALDHFPLTPNNKIDQKALPLPTANAQTTNKAHARDVIELELTRIWENAMQISPIGIDERFFDLGGHSLLAVRIMNEIELAFGKELPVSLLFQKQTIAELANVLREEHPVLTMSPAVVLKQGGGKPPLFCPHPIGGNVFCYSNLIRHFDDDQPVYGLQARSLYEDMEPHVRIEDMASEYVEAIREIQPQGPYHFAAWCFGGVIAYEMSRQLIEAGETVALLTMFDTRAPILDDQEEFDDATLLSWFARDLAIPYGKTLTIPAEELRIVGTENMFEYVLKRAKEDNVLPGDADSSQLYRFFQVYIANAIALQSYTIEPLPIAINLLRAAEEPLIAGLGETLGWNKCQVNFISTDVPGNHSTMMYEPNVKSLAEHVKQSLHDLAASRQLKPARQLTISLGAY